MAMGIVNFFELIEIEQDETKRFALTFAAQNGFMQARVGSAAGEKAGKTFPLRPLY